MAKTGVGEAERYQAKSKLVGCAKLSEKRRRLDILLGGKAERYQRIGEWEQDGLGRLGR